MHDSHGGATKAQATHCAEIAALLYRHVQRLPLGASPVTVLIDGRSGAGKTEAAESLHKLLQCQLVHLDDVYPGWAGLASATKAVSTNILSTAKQRAGYRQWDWHADAYGPWRNLNPREDLIVEGAGTVSAETVAAARQRSGRRVLTAVLEAPEEKRKTRVRHRDGDPNEWWGMWAAQENTHFARQPEPDLCIVTC